MADEVAIAEPQFPLRDLPDIAPGERYGVCCLTNGHIFQKDPIPLREAVGEDEPFSPYLLLRSESRYAYCEWYIVIS